MNACYTKFATCRSTIRISTIETRKNCVKLVVFYNRYLTMSNGRIHSEPNNDSIKVWNTNIQKWWEILENKKIKRFETAGEYHLLWKERSSAKYINTFSLNIFSASFYHIGVGEHVWNFIVNFFPKVYVVTRLVLLHAMSPTNKFRSISNQYNYCISSSHKLLFSANFSGTKSVKLALF